jgi:ribonuclease HI
MLRLGPEWNPYAGHLPILYQPRKPIIVPHSNLRQLAARTDCQGERLQPYTVAPWEIRNPWGPRLRFDASIPPSKDGKREHVKNVKDMCSRAARDPKRLIVFTDGSRHAPKSYKRTGAAFVIYYGGEVVASGKIGLGRRANVFDGEMAALAAAARKIREMLGTRIQAHESTSIRLRPSSFTHIPSSINRIDFLVDNVSAISSIYDLSPHPAQSLSFIFRKYIDAILRSSDDLSIRVSWAPGHTGIAGNEHADILAKSAATITSPAPLVSSTMSWARETSNVRASQEWSRRWLDRPRTNHAAVALRTPPSTRPWRLFRENCSGPRHITTRLIQSITGHAFFGKYYQRFRPSDPTACPCGQTPLQTREHIICECPIHERARGHLRKVSKTLSLPIILGTLKGLTAFAKFLADSTAFTKTSNPSVTGPIPDG